MTKKIRDRIVRDRIVRDRLVNDNSMGFEENSCGNVIFETVTMDVN